MNYEFNLKLLYFCFCVLTSATALGATSECIDPKIVEEVTSFFIWNKNGDYIIDFSSEICNPKSSVYKTIQALNEMRKLPELNSKPDDFNSNTIDQRPFDFFKSRISRIVFERNSKNCDPMTLAYVFLNTSAVRICPKLQESTIFEIMLLLIHESRHAEGYDHVKCHHGSMAHTNFKGCDERYESRGAYGIDTEYQIQLSRTKEISPERRAQARAGAIIRLLDRFNQYPLALKEGVYGQTTTGQLLFISKETTDLISAATPNGYPFNYLQTPIWYDFSSSQVYTLDYSGGILPVSSKDTFYYDAVKSIPLNTQRDLLDAYTNTKDAIICSLTPEKLYCTDFTPPNLKNLSFELPQRALAFVYLKDTTGIKLENGDILELPKKADLLTPEFRGFTYHKLHTPFINVITGKNKNWSFLLQADGVLHYTEDAQPSVVAPVSNLRFKRILGPFLWSERFKEL